MASNAPEIPGSDAEQVDTESGKQTEITDAEVVEDTIQPSDDVMALSTFDARHESNRIMIMPTNTHDGTQWSIVVYKRGVRGSVLETEQPMTDQQAADLGIPRQLQQRVNDALGYAKQELDLPKSLGHMGRSNRSLSDLEARME